jgi:leucyl-tRNA synthetase
MVFINHLYKDSAINKEIANGFIQILSCIAPHISEELNEQIGSIEGLVSSSN